MNKKHKHAEVIKAWADGKLIQRHCHGDWVDWLIKESPSWEEDQNYRIKPEPKPDVVKYAQVKLNSFKHPRIDISSMYEWTTEPLANIVFTFDSETGELKSAEVLK